MATSQQHVSTAPGRRGKCRDFSVLNVLYADHFKGDDLRFTDEAEKNFYRGAPPNCLNFHINEQAVASGNGTPFIKRDGYEKLKEQIQEKRKLPAISTVKLFHQSGSGGTTMAMQVLWDLRKTFRCAVLTDSNSKITEVAQEVVQLFTLDYQKTVLLLLEDEQILDELEDSIMMTIKTQNIPTSKPVAVLLSCVRKDDLVQSENVSLRRVLSENEEQKFNEKKRELEAKYKEASLQFHGFNIMQTKFSEAYIKEACRVFEVDSNTQGPQKELDAFLSLLNAYVPGSYLLESQCLDFLKSSHEKHSFEDASLEEKTHPFSQLTVTFQQDERAERKVRMAHPLIAKCCTELLADGGVTRSDTTRNFLNNFYRYEDHGQFPHYLLRFIKDMLTKREFITKVNPITGLEEKRDQERFSKLILDIQRKENKVQSVSVLKVASKKFLHNPFFPQALARFYYIELKYYNLAEMWAKRAMERDPQNSFIADTLGQVYKNSLKNMGETLTSREILQIANKAIKAFKHEEQLAEEHMTDILDDGAARFSHLFNCRGQFGFIQVCSLLYDLLVKKNETWRTVLTKNGSFCSALEELGDNKLDEFDDLVSSLKGEVEKKAEFFAEYLTFSKPKREKDDPEYISSNTSDCQKKFVGDLPSTHVEPIAQHMHELQQKFASTAAGILACMDREYSKDLLVDITRCWKEICSMSNSESDEVNFILSYVLSLNLGATFPHSPEDSIQRFRKRKLNKGDRPEQHLLSLLLHWPTDSEDTSVFDLIQEMKRSYENVYLTYFRSRYLRPLFFIGKGKDLDRLVHRKVLEKLFLDQCRQTDPDCSINWKTENIFQNDKVKDRLLKVEGEVRNHSVP